MALIKLTGKYATGPHSHAIVDDDMLDFLSQWRWKAKPNGGGNNVYAVRNARVDGRCVTVRMHRVIAGMGRNDPLEIDHDNHNSLDNRRENLIPATRSENALNARRVEQIGTCVHCGVEIKRTISACASGNRMMCVVCKAEAGTPAKRCAVFFTRCKHCDAHLTARRCAREFCNDTCRCRFRSAAGYVRPHRGRIDVDSPRVDQPTMAAHQNGAGPPLDKANGRERRLAEFAQR
ncbi:HNH endonuclease [Pandoraea sp. PE-S2T-3]|uniref:HNH endonuclease n=1 Tax=Pandoraea sp. PE-S2T-3 TaxID=1986993 RepID=UPI001124DF9D|nr:HNH endonuclease [Pandoraea sp. PE-S2T-3]